MKIWMVLVVGMQELRLIIGGEGMIVKNVACSRKMGQSALYISVTNGQHIS